jgi:hypothetical protein
MRLQRVGVQAFDPSEADALGPDDHLMQLSLDDDMMLAALPSVDTLSALRSTQHSASSSQERLLNALTAPMSADEDEDEEEKTSDGHWATFEVVADSQEDEDEG